MSSHRQEYKPDKMDIREGDGLVDVDSFRLANAWDKRLQKGMYGMGGI
jgi:hypothetical protein